MTTSASATPRPLTRCSMIWRASSRSSWAGGLAVGRARGQRDRRAAAQVEAELGGAVGPGEEDQPVEDGDDQQEGAEVPARGHRAVGHRGSPGSRGAVGWASRARRGVHLCRRRRPACHGGCGPRGSPAGEGDDHAGGISRSTVLSPRPATVPCRPLVVITGVPTVSESCMGLGLGLHLLALPERAEQEQGQTTSRIREGKCSTTDVPLYRGHCSAVGADPVGPARVRQYWLVRRARATGRARPRSLTSCAPAGGSLSAEQRL